MPSLFSSVDPVIVFLAIGGAFLLGIVGILSDSPRVRQRWIRLLPLSFIVVFAAALPLLEYRSEQGVYVAVGFLGGVCGVFYLLRSSLWVPPLQAIIAWTSKPRLQWSALVLLSLVLGGGLIYGVEEQSVRNFDDWDFIAGFDTATLMPVEHIRSITDRARVVPLYVAPPSNITVEEVAGFEARVINNLTQQMQLMRVAPPTRDSNCHGWVFADGRHWIKGEDVPLILEDNGYQPAPKPQPSDVVVFRDVTDAVSHTALVRMITGDKVVMESKWGWGSRYVHTLQGHAYGDRLTYYRSARAGHQLRFDSPGPDPKTLY